MREFFDNSLKFKLINLQVIFNFFYFAVKLQTQYADF